MTTPTPHRRQLLKMQRCEILVVEDSVLREYPSGPELELSPSLAAPVRWNGRTFTQPAWVIRPDGTEIETDAVFYTVASETGDPFDLGYWRIVVALLDITKAEAPTGSKILTSTEVADAIWPLSS